MNLFKYVAAHKNPVVTVANWMEYRYDQGKVGIFESFIYQFAKIAVKIAVFMFMCAKCLSYIYIAFCGKQKTKKLINRKKEISVVIVNWNGVRLLDKCLKSLYKALAKIPGTHEVIFVDNNSTDGSAGFVKDNFPEVKIIKLNRNTGFSIANNKGVRKAKKDLVMLLNNDMMLSANVFEVILNHFDDPRVFSVQPKVVLENGKLCEGYSWSEFKDEMLYFHNERQLENIKLVNHPAETLYPMGGCVVMDRREYWKLGGLDEMFSPFTWEDDDLGYRAAKRGYKNIYDPRVFAVHENSATMDGGEFSKTYIRMMKEKNMYLFFWKNITHPFYFQEYVKSLPRRVDIAKNCHDYVSLAAYILAFFQIGEIMRRRIRESIWENVSDKQMIVCTKNEKLRVENKKSKPHILMVMPFLPFPITHGVAVRTYNMVKNLKKDFKVSMLTFKDSPDAENIKEKLAGVFDEIYFAQRTAPVDHGLLWAELPKKYKYSISQDMETKLKSILSEDDIDVVHIEFGEMAQYIQCVDNHPSVFVEIDIGPLFYGKSYMKAEKGMEGFVEPLKAINNERLYVKNFDRVVTMTDNDTAVSRYLFPESKVITVESGVDLERFPYSYNNSAEKKLVYLGHYRHYPNEDAVVYFVNDIFPKIKQKQPDVALHLVGSSPTRPINRLKDRDDVFVTGTVANVGDYLKEGMIFIAPIRLGAGIKGKLLEAMSLGLPVVATSVAAKGLGAIDGENMMIADTPDLFAQKVIELIENPKLREKISINARKLVETRFDWRVLAKKLGNIYVELLGGVNERS